jgi:FMN-dependent NADH-azoreductase
MSKVLYIQASATVRLSKSIEVADYFVEQYRRRHPEDTIETMNLFEADLPQFDAPMAQAKYRIMHGQPHTAEERQNWSKVEKVIDHFKSADKYVFAIAMWNFSIPWRLKQYIDIIVQPGYTFKVTENGYEGLVKGKRALMVYARGGAYGPGSGSEPYDMQVDYMEMILGFMGIKELMTILVEPTLEKGPEVAAQAVRRAKERTRDLVDRFMSVKEEEY